MRMIHGGTGKPPSRYAKAEMRVNQPANFDGTTGRTCTLVNRSGSMYYHT